jgi:hypothetical protein
MREELSTEVEVLRLRFPPGSRPLAVTAFEATDGDTTLQFQWFPIQDQVVANLSLLPSFLASGLRQLPASVAHIVHRDVLS